MHHGNAAEAPLTSTVYQRLLALFPALVAALGIASAVAHASLAVGIGAAGAVTTASALAHRLEFWLAALAALSALLVLPWVIASLDSKLRACCFGARSAACRPLLYGLSVPLLATPLEPFFFRCPAPALLLLGGGLGLLASAWRLRALRASDDAPRDRALVVAVAVMAIGSVLVSGWPAPQGDEPHYLIVAHSLWEDGDIDLADDYGDRVYGAYHPGPLSPHYKPGLEEGSRYSMHGVGYPLLLLPAYFLGRLISPTAPVAVARALQMLLYALFAFSLYRLIELLANRQAALLGTVTAVGLAPLVLAPLHLFPETAAMTLMCASVWLMLRPDSGLPGADWLAGLLLALLPWLGVKYIPLVGCAAVLGPWAANRAGWARRMATGLSIVLVSLAAHALFTWMLYGSLSPSAVYLGSDPSFGRQPGFGDRWTEYLADWPNAGRTLIGYFMDQKEGLLAVGPHYLLAAAGLPFLLRRHRRVMVLLSAMAAAYLLPYALSQQAGGHSPPARPAMAVAWMLAIPLGVGLVVLRRRFGAAVRGSLLLLATVLVVLFVRDPSLLPHDYGIGSSWLLRSLSPAGAELWRWFPLWINIAEPHWAVAAAWLVVTLSLGWWLFRAGDNVALTERAAPSLAAWGAAACCVVLAAAVGLAQARVVLSDRHVGVQIAPGITAWVQEAVPASAWVEPGGVWIAPRRRVEVTLTSSSVLAAQRGWLRTLVAGPVRLEFESQVWTGTVAPQDPISFRWVPGQGTSWRGVDAYRFRLWVRQGAAPADLEGGADRRVLGVHVRLEEAEGG